MDSPNFTENVVVYIGLPAERRGRILNAHGQNDLAGEMNRNTISPPAASRSTNNNNNNNITAATTQRSRTVQDVCEKKPSYHSKVLLCRDDEQHSNEHTTGWLFNRERCHEAQQTSMIKSRTTVIELFKWSSPHCNHKDVFRVSKFFSVPKDSCFTQQNALFNMEILQDREQAEQGSGKGRWTSHKRNNYLGMMSLFGPVSSHLWPVEMKPSCSSSHIISLLG
ncbi:hypothetical protein PHYPO_G00181940 [Pangasianodon hypophthalmus]|uniref:Uncharacterized protein n=1 Tax=Pangasianodon hypophthalmus TaxID=310915 RepID=A0A5N5PQM2_PANHP|nr:uncharacterized protein LOC113542106 [Pangasianodon hypophthalmus]KAB5581984.1 hypothetical protein PHYPO_G00181940 [Pangasianodon hypophthalmus]